ncbi:putative short-chain dehydrogenases/reductase [Myriangium duriaei CBS 260.36]|uniref:Short-chain dehydrogenases/reductase n=1 Tax=Myriangium duriaei CBS 260.36 TaxID=1168546 RepID=A0A9P4MEI8_9PEZI|nr:putative short-chain dehydrogenases/reductase [Myriangium duriaei CBS 260.36]
MVALEAIRASNERIATTLPAGLVAVFIGATNGVGETTVRQFAKYAQSPRVYIIGRSQEAGTRITKECKELNPRGEFTFISKDTSLMRNVDELCGDLKRREKTINLLFLTIGTLQRGIKTAEGMHYPAALTVHARNRFMTNLLPLVSNAPSLRRVVSVFIGGLEGPKIDMDDFQGWHMKLMANRGHAASITTLTLEGHHKTYPQVSFVHNFPGVVRSGIARGTGLIFAAFSAFGRLFGRLIFMDTQEAGDRHLFLATSARYSASRDDTAAGVPLGDHVDLARGTDGVPGSGVYSIDANGESASQAVEKVLAGLRTDGMVEKVMNALEEDIQSALAIHINT